MCDIVFLYNYAVNILCIKIWDGHGFHCLLRQLEMEIQLTSNRKLPNFYEKVTDFLWESYRISKWWQNSILTEAWRIWLYRRAEQTVYLCNRISCHTDISAIRYSMLPYRPNKPLYGVFRHRKLQLGVSRMDICLRR